jgi:hypothetical protein
MASPPLLLLLPLPLLLLPLPPLLPPLLVQRHTTTVMHTYAKTQSAMMTRPRVIFIGRRRRCCRSLLSLRI